VDKVALFVDVQNIYYTVRDSYKRHFNYNVFWERVTKDRELVGAFAYAIDKGDPKQRKFQQILRKIGFEVKLKNFIQRRDGSAKGDWDVGITIDMIEYADKADVLVLASGDGDFDLLADKIRERHKKRIEVYGVPQWTAGSLIRSATQYFPIDSEDYLF
jgi:uncharacterized LabA/DUF88 family protein